ncbi:MAG: GNAT family N-acetyltransferase [Actinomycetota bacterium]|nr:GNAT family N-acetyltransferase [Actinomycetota bacterium]
MEITVTRATHEDVDRLVEMYLALEPEQTARKPVWALTDGLDETFSQSFIDAINAPESWVFVGRIDGSTVGMIWATIEPMLARANGSRIGKIRIVFTEEEARGVGVGHEMLETALEVLRGVGIRYFDAPVGPGQRSTKNFFEGHQFAARSIIMHHADDPTTGNVSEKSSEIGEPSHA